jgi:hypothetical protein
MGTLMGTKVPGRSEMPVKAAVNAAKAGCALIVLSFVFSPSAAADPATKASQMKLVSTDTSEPYPFATIVVDDKTYHVTEGDRLDGLYIRHISPGRVTLSDDEVLIAATQ